MDQVVPDPENLVRLSRIVRSPYYEGMFSWWTVRVAAQSQVHHWSEFFEGYDFVRFPDDDSDWMKWVSIPAMLRDYKAWDQESRINSMTFASRIRWITGVLKKKKRKAWAGEPGAQQSTYSKLAGIEFNAWRWHAEHHYQVRLSLGLIS